jgi:RTX calcium-binding nonapeptide repeat (4 copies)
VRRIMMAIVAAVLMGGLTACEPPVGAPVPDVLIDFDSDGTVVELGTFTSDDSPFVHFSSTLAGDPAGFVIADGYLIAIDSYHGGLQILLDRPTNRITMQFGNDDLQAPFLPHSQALLQVFRGATKVGETRVLPNFNDLIDQSIGFQNGPLFDRVVFVYEDVRGLGEQVDDIVIGPLCTIAGTEASQTLTGTPGNDVICAGGGNDTVFGGAGRDHIIGGNGTDTLNGEGGEDFIAGNFQNDTIHGGDQNDRVEGGQHDDNVFGDAGNDFVSGGPGTDTCNGGPGTDTQSGCETAVDF